MPKRTLLVEGNDDKHVMVHLCKNHDISLDYKDIIDTEGVDSLLKELPVRLKAGKPGDIIGIVVDADEDLSARWRSLRNIMVAHSYLDVPNDPTPTGCILDPPPQKIMLPRLGVWMMPDNRSAGILENFLRFLIPPHGTALLNHVEESINSIPPEHANFRPIDRPKAVIHTWLAWQEDPGKPFGTAITKRFLDPSMPEVGTIVAWLRQLFFPSL